MIRLRLDLAYDGTDFAGWAIQPGQRTVQGVVQEALAIVLRLNAPAVVHCAGRTDAGVHARGQVAHVDVPTDEGFDTLPRGLRGLLPNDVWLTDVSAAPMGFDARYSALSRTYRYLICDVPAAWDPLRRREVVRIHRRLDITSMNLAAVALLGGHDFAALCKPRGRGSTIRQLLGLTWRRGPTGLAEMTVSADAFCHTLVRGLVGVLVPVGEGRKPPDWPASVVAGRVRDPYVTGMPPHGLVLEQVTYPPDSELAARQRLTRTVRTLDD